MEWNIVEWRIDMETNEIIVIQKGDNGAYSAYVNSLEYGYPKGSMVKDIEEYLLEHDTQGYSCDGTYDEVIAEIR